MGAYFLRLVITETPSFIKCRLRIVSNKLRGDADNSYKSMGYKLNVNV